MIDKEYLRNHAEHREELEDELRRYELMNGCSYYKSPSNISGMPHASGGSSDRIADSIIKKSDCETYIDRLETIINEEKIEIEKVISRLPRAKQKTVIRVKYYQRYDWDDVALFMFGDRRDYAGHSEKYKSKAQKIHGNALANIAKLQKEDVS